MLFTAPHELVLKYHQR